jgi:1A family penicillin-binding protein
MDVPRNPTIRRREQRHAESGIRSATAGQARRRRFKGIRIMLPVLFVVSATTLFWLLHDLAVSSVLAPSWPPVVLLEAADGTALARKGAVRDPPVGRRALPQYLVDAVVAIEDQRFYSHRGIDPRGIMRAVVRNLKAGGVVEGGSTITQQLVKLLNGKDQRTFRRKLREAALAIAVERKLSKDEILIRYLNSIYFGAGVTGLPAAARFYFDKPVNELTLEESVLLAGMIKAPSKLNPLRNIQAARQRAALVLDAMVASGKLTASRAEIAKQRPAELSLAVIAPSSGLWFADWIYNEALKTAASSDSKPEGIRVRTTLSPRLQILAERVIEAALAKRGKAAEVTQAALVAMRPDGAVLAMVGGRNYQQSQFNRAVHAMRQPGSTFKLFVYFAALRSGYAPEDMIADAPLKIGRWSPKNFDRRYHGMVSLREAFAHSLNVATVRLAQQVGIGEVTAAARALGIDARLTTRPSLALGASEVSLLDLTGAYASVRSGVGPIEPWAIADIRALDPRHPFAARPRPSPKESLGPYHQPLLQLLHHVVEHGTGRAAALNRFAAGKTGTTENHRDAWFIGFTDELITGVWVGNDDNRPMKKVTGGKFPAAIWKEFMTEALKMPDMRAPEPVAVAARALPSVEDDHPDDLSRVAARCSYDACASAYRSFRPSDCSYQPYRGSRILCRKGMSAGELIAGLASDAGTAIDYRRVAY